MKKLLVTAAICAVTTPEQMYQCMQSYIAQWTQQKPLSSETANTMNFRNPRPEWIIKAKADASNLESKNSLHQ